MKKGLLIIAAAALLALACNEEGETGPSPQGPPVATSPVNVLKCVEISFNRADIKILADVLSPNFVFYFDPHDVGQNPPGGSSYVIPESWGYAQFWRTARRMFIQAYSVSLTVPTGAVGEPDPNETTYRVENTAIQLLVMIDELNGYIANGYCNFEFERYDGAEGQKLWRLTKWWDRTAVGYDANPGLVPTSFGKILAMFD